MTGCRFCSRTDGELRPVRLDAGAARGPGGALARRMARVPVLEHAACLSRYTVAAWLAGEIRLELHRAARDVLATGDLEGTAALLEASADVLDSDYLDVVA